MLKSAKDPACNALVLQASLDLLKKCMTPGWDMLKWEQKRLHPWIGASGRKGQKLSAKDCRLVCTLSNCLFGMV